MPSINSLVTWLSRKEFVVAFESIAFIVGIVVCISYLVPRPLVHPEYVPNAVTGFATASGVLAAFTGFWLTHIYGNASQQTKKWLLKRIAVLVPLIGFCLLIVFGGLYQLVFGSIEQAMAEASLGTALLIVVDFEVSYMTFYRGFSKDELD